MSSMTLPRRTFLKGLGLSVGLPMLDAMSSPSANAKDNAVAAPVRMAFVFVPNGVVMNDWTPAKFGDNYKLSKTLSGLAEFKDDFNVLSGLAQDNGRAKGDGPGDHARSASSYLTGAHPYKTAGADIRVGVSVDQVAADRIGEQTNLPSLELGTERGQNSGNCDSGYSCAYSSNISWKTETTPVAKEINPRLAFERLFGGEKDTVQRAKRDFYRKSILDLVAGDAAKLKQRLGKTDRQKIDEYFTCVRELEQRILHAEQTSNRERPEFKTPTGVPKDYQEYVRLMYDILVMAFRTDSTRVATYMLANAGSNRSYPMVGVSQGHHQLSHHRSQPDKLEKLAKIDRFQIDQFAYFLGQLKSVGEGEGTLLDNVVVMYGSGLGDGNRHNHHELPILLAGRGGNTIRTGRHIKQDSETPLNNLFLSMLDRIGANVDKLGDSSGRLTVIDA